MKRRALLLAGVAAGVIAAAPSAYAQAADTASDTVVVTGRAGYGERLKSETSYSITAIDTEALRLQAPTSVTEALKSVPGYWVEASGGEASGNVRARGVPVDGFGSVNLLEDGVPVQHDPALGYLNADQVFRLDETIDRIEVVRGGPSSVFYSNAPAGVINFVPREAGDEAEGVFKVTLGEDQAYRTDFWYGGPIGDWKLAAGGFFRSETGVRDPGYTGNLGGQFRVTAGRDVGDGRFSVDLKRMDDQVVFYTGIPMYRNTDGELVAVPGFDGNYGTLAGPETTQLDMKMADGTVYHYDNTEGTHVKRTQLTGRFDQDFADGWRFASTLRYSDTETQRNGFFPNQLLTGASLLQQAAPLLAAAPGATSLQLRYVTTPTQAFDVAAQNGNGDVTVAGLRGLTLPVQEYIADNQVTHQFGFAGTHDLTFGYYFAHISEDFDRYSSSYITDVRDNARLLDLVAVGADGSVIAKLTDNGVYQYGYEWEHASGEQTTNALYVADEWQITPALRIDGGLRWEDMSTNGAVGLKQTVNAGPATNRAMLIGNGQFAHYDNSFEKLAWTVGANYQFTDSQGVFARYTDSNRLPSLGNYVTSAGATPIVQTMDLGEVGYKLTTDLVNLYATGFWTQYHDVGFTNYVFNLNGPTVSQALYADTETYGVELEGGVFPVDWFDVTATATYQEPQYKGLTYTDNANKLQDYDGNQLIRVPKASVRVVPGLNLLDDRLRLQASIEYEDVRYVDTANSVKLPDYWVTNLSGSYEITPALTLFGYVDNVDNSLGLTEGNPRAGEVSSADAGANAFIARPILGRNYRLALLYKF